MGHRSIQSGLCWGPSHARHSERALAGDTPLQKLGHIHFVPGTIPLPSVGMDQWGRGSPRCCGSGWSWGCGRVSEQAENRDWNHTGWHRQAQCCSAGFRAAPWPRECPGCAQGPRLMATSCRTLVGQRYTGQPGLWALGLSGKGCSAVWILPGSWEGALLQSRGWRKCLPWPGTVCLVPGWALMAQFNPGPPRGPCCGLPKVLLHWIWSHRCLCRAGAQALCLPFRASLGGCLCLHWKNGVVSL